MNHKETRLATLEERYLSSYDILNRLGRADADGVPLGNTVIQESAPDQWRIICEACFGFLWNRPALSVEQRSLATISALVALRRDDNLTGHLYSGLDVGLSPNQITEIMLQLIFYAGAPMVNTALARTHDVLQARGIQIDPYRVYDTTEDPEALYQRGLEKRREVLGESPSGDAGGGGTGDDDWDRYLVEYLWGSIWTRPGLSTQERCLCTLTTLTVVGADETIKDYVRAALRVGLTEAQVKELCLHLTFYIGVSLAERAKALAEEVFASA